MPPRFYYMQSAREARRKARPIERNYYGAERAARRATASASA